MWVISDEENKTIRGPFTNEVSGTRSALRILQATQPAATLIEAKSIRAGIDGVDDLSYDEVGELLSHFLINVQEVEFFDETDEELIDFTDPTGNDFVLIREDAVVYSTDDGTWLSALSKGIDLLYEEEVKPEWGARAQELSKIAEYMGTPGKVWLDAALALLHEAGYIVTTSDVYMADMVEWPPTEHGLYGHVNVDLARIAADQV